MCEKKSRVEVPVGSVAHGPFSFIGFIFYIVFFYCFIVKYALVNCIINKYRTENIKSPFRKLFNNNADVCSVCSISPHLAPVMSRQIYWYN